MEDQIEEKHQDVEENESSSEQEGFNKEDLHCRFYRNEWPERQELVMVKICNVNEEGAYVQLLEYNNREGLILAASIAKKRIKNVKSLLKLGSQEVMQVMNVDQGFIDLSKKTMQIKDVEEKKQMFNKSKVVHLIMNLTAFNLQCKTIELYEAFGWDLYDKFGHAYNAFKLALTDPDVVFEQITITPEQKSALLANISKKMAAKPIKLRAIFNLQCYTFEGIEAIRESLLETKKQTQNEKF
jgi:translation initiation factor 2 subunit 1